ncbi:hypothetical protein HPP92_004359 [Vanilla planifolia]|uniref:Uncharacterized protein n=1 Tax=Vanilla planifolia TaxID=51239 RepID=A0A835RS40_VANPL|nr:hypothetical protein HPP92_004359 [Vanilla planifolia]
MNGVVAGVAASGNGVTGTEGFRGATVEDGGESGDRRFSSLFLAWEGSDSSEDDPGRERVRQVTGSEVVLLLLPAELEGAVTMGQGSCNEGTGGRIPPVLGTGRYHERLAPATPPTKEPTSEDCAGSNR